MPSAAVIGPVNVDLFIRGRAPLDAAELNQWVGPADVDLLVAGSVGYTVQALNRLGVHVELCTTFGDDAFGGHLGQALAEQGVGLKLSRSAPGGTAIAIYMLMFGGAKRPMTYRLPGFDPWPDPIPIAGSGGFELVHCGGLLHFPNMWHRSLASVMRDARAAGAMTSLDPQFPLTDMPVPWLPHMKDVMPHIDVLLCDERESTSIFDVGDPEQAVRIALGMGPRIVAVKLGAKGCVVSDGRELVRQPSVEIPVDEVRESVGAGDAFDAGFLAALMRGMDIAGAARLATAAAALTLAGRGGSERIEGWAAVESAAARVPQSSLTRLANDSLHHA
jgi:sugar/nucleoside kinase (ribokinase family)